MREKNYIDKSSKLLRNSIGIMGAVFGLCICMGLSMPETASAKKVGSTLKKGINSGFWSASKLQKSSGGNDTGKF